jgi:hypothetical protein
MTTETPDVKTIFGRALEIESPTERAAYLDEVCGEKAVLRAEVDELLKAHVDAGSFLDNPPMGSERRYDSKVGDTIEADQISLSFLEPCDEPDRIGKLGVYQIIEVVGHGGMGIVLRACDTKLNRTVAIKVMAPELAFAPMAVKRFLSESQKAAAVVHEHVVTIHAVEDSHRPPYR